MPDMQGRTTIEEQIAGAPADRVIGVAEAGSGVVQQVNIPIPQGASAFGQLPAVEPPQMLEPPHIQNAAVPVIALPPEYAGILAAPVSAPIPVDQPFDALVAADAAEALMAATAPSGATNPLDVLLKRGIHPDVAAACIIEITRLLEGHLARPVARRVVRRKTAKPRAKQKVIPTTTVIEEIA